MAAGSLNWATDLKPIDLFFTGKPDIYHSLQACLIPLFPATGSLMTAIGEEKEPSSPCRDL
jgi:sulfoquinovose isomerase